MKKAVFLDRDGTINVDKEYLYEIDRFEFLPGVLDGLRTLEKAGYLLIIITNQSGIARGYYTEEDFYRLNKWMLEQLEKEGIHVSQVYFCPHLPDAKVPAYRKECDCRKPAIGMFLRAIEDWHIDPSMSWVIGDKIRDCAICHSTDCLAILVGQGESANVIEAIRSGSDPNIRYAPNFVAAVEMIIHGIISW